MAVRTHHASLGQDYFFLPSNASNGHIMSFYTDSIYPALVERLGNPGPIQVLRREIVPRADGTVLEIGVGSGLNFPITTVRG
jgi:hypothetical protein